MGWQRFFRRRRWDEERARELQVHLEMETEDNIARGMTPEKASRAAHRKLGNRTRIREEIYEMNTLGFVETLWQDGKYGLRLLGREPTFAAVAILSLALGTGANAAIFQLLNAVRLRQLPVERPGEIVSIKIDSKDRGRTGRFMGRSPDLSEPLWQSLVSEQQAFESLLAWGTAKWNLATNGEYRPADGLFVNGGFFGALGVPAYRGRLFTAADDHVGCGASGAVVGHGFWQARYSGDPSVIGQPISLDGRPFPILGVTPPDFFGVEVGRSFDVALLMCAEPLMRAEAATGKPDHWWLGAMGRLKPDWSAERADAHLRAISKGLFQETLPPTYTAETARQYLDFELTATPAATGVSSLRRTYATPLWVLLGATSLVLLVTCANLANLMLSRATVREREMALRLTLGATRLRVIRQLLSESLLIAAFGALGGALVAQWMSRALVAFLSTETSPLFVDLSPDWRTFAFIAAIAVIACLLFGLSPALQATATSSGAAKQVGGRSTTDSRERLTVRRGLIVVQVALSLVLLVGAMLFGRSLRNLLTLDPGFRADGVLVASVDLRRAGVDPSELPSGFEQIVDRIAAVPGVTAAAQAYIVPMSGSLWNQSILIGGAKQPGMVNFNRVGVDYFEVMRTPLLAGRPFASTDRHETTPVSIVNESFVRRYFPGGEPIGQTFQIEAALGDARPLYEIVGVVQDTKYTDLREDFPPIVYLAAAQETEPGPAVDIVIRSGLPLASSTSSITSAIAGVHSNVDVAYDTIQSYTRNSLVTERLMATLSGFFGILAVLIATIGLYGVMSYLVERRRHEVGIRMALGADRRAVLHIILRDAGLLVILGVLLGTALAIPAARAAQALLFGLAPWDPIALGAGAASLTAVAALASYLPAQRAAGLDPNVALRQE